ncbi:hypothetical protein MHU86_16586 [Fragilaria crotonensis]|nr:hypothetical protein MHU86_16586 [Fragilaria crotonensis]
MAASHLQDTAARASPLVLWDLLGRLLSLLIRQTWTCRQHAQWAMQGVAQFLPRANQEEFMARDSVLLSQENTNLWLTVEDLDIQLVLQRGRHLLAAPEQHYDHDDDEDSRLDGLDVSSSDFVHQRIQLQRRILAKRLGLGGLVQATGNVDEWLPDTITTQDFITPAKTSSLNASSKVRTVVKDTKDDDKSIRALLVLEVKQQDATP